MNTLPNELLLQITVWLSGPSLVSFFGLNKRHRTLLRPSLDIRPVVAAQDSQIIALKQVISSLNSLSLSNYIKSTNSILLTNQFLLSFQQNVETSFRVLDDQMQSPTEEYPLGRPIGPRYMGDRCIVSRFPLAFHSKVAFERRPNDQSCQVAYFEATIISVLVPDTCIRIGLVDKNWDPFRPIGSMPGSISYINTDGNVSVGTKYDDRFMLGPPFTQGDTIGCGRTKKGTVFFTLNGKWIAEAPYKLEPNTKPIDYTSCVYAAVSASCQCEIVLNLGTCGMDSFMYTLSPQKCAPFLLVRQENYSLLSPDDPLCFVSLSSLDTNQRPRIHGMTIEFLPSQQDCQSIQTNIPFHSLQDKTRAKKRGYFYFEMTILFAPDGATSFLSIGLAERPYPSGHHIGWNRNSVGYHSDDGHLFHQSYSGTSKISPGFGIGSIIGVGYEPIGQTVFFTHDGQRLDLRMVVKGILYPSIAASSNWMISLNMGQSQFYFQEANM